MKKIVLLTFFILLSVFLFGEEEPVTFEKPEPYTDYEFEEIQRTYLKQRKIRLAALEKLPLNQYPEEFILELINMIKSDIRKDMYKEFSKYKKEILNLKPSIETKDKEVIRREEEKKELFDTSKIITYNQNKQVVDVKTSSDLETKTNKEKINKDKLDKVKQDVKTEDKIKKEDESLKKEDKDLKQIKDQKIQENKDNKPREKTPNEGQKKDFSKENVITTFSINGDDPFIGINYLSKTPVKIKVKTAPEVKFVDISFYVRNITDNMIYLIKRFPLAPVQETYSFVWESPSIPFGKYKPYIEVKFYDSKKNLLSTAFQNWGNSSSNNIYIILKN